MSSEKNSNPSKQPLQLQFVTAEHPDRFREKSVRKLIRGHIRRGAIAKRVNGDQSQQKRDGASVSNEKSPESSEESCESERVGSYLETVSKRRKITQEAVRQEYARMQHSKIILSMNLMDEFQTLSKYQHKGLRADVLVSDFFGLFGKPFTANYLQLLLEGDTAFLSFCCLPAMWKSQISRKPARTCEFLTARQEVIQRVNRAICMSSPNTSNDTIMSIHHQLFIDFYVSSREVITAHTRGLDRLVQLRGGLDALEETGEIAHAIRVGVLVAGVIADMRVPSIYRHSRTTISSYIDPISPLPDQWRESPLNWEGQHMSSLVECSYCTPRLHSLMCEMQELTQTFLTYGVVAPPRQNTNYQRLLQYHSRPYADMGKRFRSIREKRSAWIYEACRLSSIIYAAALCYHLPLKTAWTKAAEDFDSVSILEELGYAIFNTDFHGDSPMWGSLISCFFWVSFVASASAYTNIDTAEKHPRDQALLSRSLLIQPVTYLYGIFHSDLAEDAFQSINTMLNIQALLALDRPQSPEAATVYETPSLKAEDKDPQRIDLLYKLTAWKISSREAGDDTSSSQSTDAQTTSSG